MERTKGFEPRPGRVPRFPALSKRRNGGKLPSTGTWEIATRGSTLMTPERIWLDVPFDEKDDAKAGGARWDPAARRWFAPRPGMAALDRWAAQPDLPAVLPGEDRSFGSGLFVDLVPSSCWFTNVRSCVVQKDWERLHRLIVDRAERRCEACGRSEDREAKRWLQAHERWDYDEARQVQTLKRLVCLCSDCHTATHFGLAGIKGLAEEALVHLCSVTGMSRGEAERHVAEAFETWRARSTRTWTLDLGILSNVGVAFNGPPTADDRVAAAEHGWHNARRADEREAFTSPGALAGAAPTPVLTPAPAVQGTVRRRWFGGK
jgi:hypothetical protein